VLNGSGYGTVMVCFEIALQHLPEETLSHFRGPPKPLLCSYSNLSLHFV